MLASRFKCLRPLLFALAWGVISAGRALGGVANGSFETGDLSGWTIVSQVGMSAADTLGPVESSLTFTPTPLPTDGSYSARLYAQAFEFATDGPVFSEVVMEQTFFAGYGDEIYLDYAANYARTFDSEGDWSSFGYQVDGLLRGPDSTDFQWWFGNVQTIYHPGTPWLSEGRSIYFAGDYTLQLRVKTELLETFPGADPEFLIQELLVDNVRLNALSTQQSPLPPNAVFPAIPPLYIFADAPNGQWYDPGVGEELSFVMSTDVLFTKILELPSGVAEQFDVTIDGQLFGTFAPGEMVDFSQLSGGGTNQFEIRLPQGTFAGADSLPLRLLFSETFADFQVRSVYIPEPQGWALGLAAACSAAVLVRRRPKHRMT